MLHKTRAAKEGRSMLAFISDLHFADGTAGEHNIRHRAFRYFFDDLITIAANPNNKIKEVKVVLLGDIFDVIRSTTWLEQPEDERPWGYNEIKIEGHAEKILDAIIQHPENAQSFGEIQQGLAKLKNESPFLESEPRLVYVPGNHDRLCNKYSILRQKVCQAFGITRQQHNPAHLFPHRFEEPRYGVFARHGHEFDKYNYEGGDSYTDIDYERVPIGDPITTELVVRLPWELAKRLAPISWLTPVEKETIKRNFQEIDNVRPLAAVIPWLLYQVKRQRRLKEIIEDVVDDVVKDFNRLNYVRLWYGRHDRWTDPFDHADRIQAVLFLLEKFKIFHTERLLSLAEKAKGLFYRDDLQEAAPREFFRLDPRLQYVVYGHTHEPLVTPLRTVPAFPQPLEHTYLNTGTWRTRHIQATHDDSFLSWKNLTYVIFYREDERPGREARFETWTGTLKYA
jgi:UDP-2,3-diacylglucosamine pyrophosphatase LpxH